MGYSVAEATSNESHFKLSDMGLRLARPFVWLLVILCFHYNNNLIIIII